ncbi:hypothetical protein WR25_17752 [Diploscapter pachys]|uniref:Transthyretin-like family protein n=1 Tax=Diploscapter pachys TaxID=2018661 RepID=A0A2A2LPH1_9BILA|nr:hypothetical protein WR25_17752 [Diploscapter pachys]
MRFLILALFVGSASAINIFGRTQSAGIRGKLVCDGKPASGVKVRLMESDNSIGFGVLDTDDVMGSGKTDSDGNYVISGTNKEITGIEPYLAIYHDCNDGIKPCQRTFRIGIPSSYVTSGSSPKKTFDAGQLELAGKYPGEGRSCFH